MVLVVEKANGRSNFDVIFEYLVELTCFFLKTFIRANFY